MKKGSLNYGKEEDVFLLLHFFVLLLFLKIREPIFSGRNGGGRRRHERRAVTLNFSHIPGSFAFPSAIDFDLSSAGATFGLF
jgi:hypothetical protein